MIDMRLVAFGINHKTAPVDIRERVAFAPDRLPEALRSLTSRPGVSEAAILSTCNRTELYCLIDDPESQQVLEWFTAYHSLNAQQVSPYTYVHPDSAAVRHLLRVASGLDSLVLGEPQILGQVKVAYQEAVKAGTMGTILNRLCQHTFSVAKQVRTDTAIGESPVSVAFAAVSLAKQIFSEFERHTVMLIGAGETVELAARHLKEAGIGRIIIANRTLERAKNLAQEVNGYAISLGEIPTHLAEADIVISSTASPLPILGKGTVESAVRARRHKPMLMVDIAVPRDIESEVSQLADVYLYTVDDLDQIIQEGLKSRQEAAVKAEDIIDTQVHSFMGWLRSQAAVDVVRQYRARAESYKQTELAKALKLLRNGESAEEVLQRLANGLTNKLLHEPSVHIRQAGVDGRTDMLSAARELLNLKDPDQ